MKIKSNLKELMQKENISCCKLANTSGASRPAIKDLYNNVALQYSKRTLELLCKYFNCTINDLLTVEND